MLSTWALWVWKVRSTATPWAVLRTVKEEFRPRLRRAMTTPSKACSLWRVPSVTRTWTTTESPGANSGTSCFSCSASSCAMMLLLMPCSTMLKVCAIALRSLLEVVHVFVQPGLLLGGEPPLFQQLRPSLPGPAQGLLQPPALDVPVVPRPQHLRHPLATKHLGAGVVGAVQQPVAEGVLLGRFLVAQGPRQQPGHRIHQHHGRQFAAAEHVVADGPLFVHLGLQQPLVDALVAASQQNQLLPPGQLCHGEIGRA